MASAIDRREGAAPPDSPAAGEVIACHECGTVHRLPAMADDTIARCTACGARIFIRFEQSLQRTLALYLAALCLVLVANAFPIMTMSLEGQSNAATILDSAKALYDGGMWPLAIAVALAGVVFPLAKILGMLAILLPLHLGLRPPWTVAGFRWVERLQPWAMMEVYLLGVIVAYVKLQDLATIHLGVAIIAFVGTILLLAAADARFDPHVIWRRLAPQAGPDILEPKPDTVLLACEQCDQVVRAEAAHLHGLVCPRCGTAIHRRKPDSLDRTWALVLTAVILYIPANLLPVLTVISFGKGAPSTIIGGVIELVHAEMLPVAILVFFASILVPVLKLIGLGVPPAVDPARMVGPRRRPDAALSDRSRASAAGRWWTCS